MLIDDGGNLLLLCSKCKTIWQGNLTPVESSTSAKKPTQRMMMDSLLAKPSMMKDFGIDMKSIDALKLK
jgi:hypothetical protein